MRARAAAACLRATHEGQEHQRRTRHGIVVLYTDRPPVFQNLQDSRTHAPQAGPRQRGTPPLTCTLAAPHPGPLSADVRVASSADWSRPSVGSLVEPPPDDCEPMSSLSA